MRAVAVIVASGLALAGCIGNSETPFPDGLEPLEENTAPPPEGDGPYPELLSGVYGEELDYDWGHARAYVHASAGATWDALQNPDVVTDRRNTSEQSYELNVEPEYDFSFLLHYKVDMFITVEWDELWRYGVAVGSSEAPKVAIARYQKVYGTEFIDLLEGSIIIKPVEAQITEVEFVQHVRATMAGKDDIRKTFESQFGNLAAAVHGQPLPF